MSESKKVGDGKPKESVRSAWTRAVRQEALRMRNPAVSKIAGIGILIATYADADGNNAFPGSDTLAPIAGSTRETIGRAVKVLLALGLMERRRGQGTRARYTLLMPLGDGRVDWDSQLWLYTDTRQARRRREIKQQDVLRRAAGLNPGDEWNPFTPAYWAANPDSGWRPLGDPHWTPPTPEQTGTASGNAVRTAFPTGDPDSVPRGDSGQRSRRDIHDPGQRSRTPPDSGADRSPDSVPGGGVHSSVDPPRDTDMVEVVAQPQVRAPEAEGPSAPAPDLQALDGGGRGARGGQPPLLLSVREPAPLDHARIATHMSGLYRVRVPRHIASRTAVQIVGDLDLPDPTAYVLAALDADPAAYRPPLPDAAAPPQQRAAGTS